MKVRVTFEFATRPPLSATFPDVETRAPSAAASRAIRRAKAQLKPRGWTSAVILLERTEVDDEAD